MQNFEFGLKKKLSYLYFEPEIQDGVKKLFLLPINSQFSTNSKKHFCVLFVLLVYFTYDTVEFNGLKFKMAAQID
jgi:hypothetical protein